MKIEAHLVVLQRILHGERLDELLRPDKTQPVLQVKGQLHVSYIRNRWELQELINVHVPVPTHEVPRPHPLGQNELLCLLPPSNGHTCFTAAQ